MYLQAQCGHLVDSEGWEALLKRAKKCVDEAKQTTTKVNEAKSQRRVNNANKLKLALDFFEALVLRWAALLGHKMVQKHTRGVADVVQAERWDSTRTGQWAWQLDRGSLVTWKLVLRTSEQILTEAFQVGHENTINHTLVFGEVDYIRLVRVVVAVWKLNKCKQARTGYNIGSLSAVTPWQHASISSKRRRKVKTNTYQDIPVLDGDTIPPKF